MTFRVVRTNQYNQDLGLIHSTNGNHLESPNEGSSIDHQVTIHLHAQNITMFPTNESWYFTSQILVSSSGGLILILTAQSTMNEFRIHSAPSREICARNIACWPRNRQQRLAETCRSSAQMIAPLADVLSRLDAPPVGRCPEKRRAADGLLSRVDYAPGGWMAAPLRAVPRERESSLVTRSSRMVARRIDTRGALVDVLVRAGRVMRDCVALVARKIRGG
ncbi:oxalate oxidase 1-like [Dorcoceras hygrometricum]|uniref:Oxalate oxidase 1-like n=1 Tax=Dorcoceras hygrometricum TaxID=472368 RepID=A0A2Z7CSU1_9LAMI|nr:oxalate oxidase 1-like [Dorcoceras hygrometricum]